MTDAFWFLPGAMVWTFAVCWRGKYTDDHQARGAVKWPLDPPPVVEYLINDNDAQKTWLHSPYWFCTVDVQPVNSHEPLRPDTITGTLTSSLHKVKLHDSKSAKLVRSGSYREQDADHGFFVFGDVYLKYPGIYRLRFTVFEMRQR